MSEVLVRQTQVWAIGSFARRRDVDAAERLRSMQPNGLAVLHKVLGLVESIEGALLKQLSFYSVLPEDPGELANVQFPKASEILGVRRIALHKGLLDTTTKLGVNVRWGHKLVDLHQDEDSVTVKFENGHTDTASFVVGCDGLHSNTRTSLFGAEKADFTGLIQVRDRLVAMIPSHLDRHSRSGVSAHFQQR